MFLSQVTVRRYLFHTFASARPPRPREPRNGVRWHGVRWHGVLWRRAEESNPWLSPPPGFEPGCPPSGGALQDGVGDGVDRVAVRALSPAALFVHEAAGRVSWRLERDAVCRLAV